MVGDVSDMWGHFDHFGPSALGGVVAAAAEDSAAENSKIIDTAVLMLNLTRMRASGAEVATAKTLHPRLFFVHQFKCTFGELAKPNGVFDNRLGRQRSQTFSWSQQRRCICRRHLQAYDCSVRQAGPLLSLQQKSRKFGLKRAHSCI